MPRPVSLAFLLALALAACGGPSEPPAREFPLTGQVLALRPDVLEITIRHDDIPGFMDAMTMPFKVKDRRLLEDRTPGDIVRATLVVTHEESYLSKIEKTGWAPPPPPVPEPAITAADLIDVGDEVPDQVFIDEGGEPLALSSLRGSAVVLTFTYTRCPLPEFCPLMDRRFAELQEMIEADPARSRRVKLLTVSFDPDHDKPEVLAAHAERLGANPQIWRFVTAERDAVDRFSAGFGLVVMRDSDAPGGITHNLRTAILDPDGRLLKVYGGSEWTPQQVLDDLGELSPGAGDGS